MEDIQLTPAELEMIKIKREQFELAKKEEEAKKAIQLAKDIEAKKEYIKKSRLQDQVQIAAAKDYLSQLGVGYTLSINTRNETVQIMGDYIDKANGFDRHILWSEVFERQTASLKRDSYTIQIVEQITYSSKWSSRGTSQGFKMYVSGPGIEWKQERRAYSRATKVNEIIKEAIDKIDTERKAAEAKKNAVHATVDRFTAEYPGAEVTTDRGWEKGYGRKNWQGTTYDMVRVKFTNGCSIAYRVYGDGSLSRVSFNLPGAKDEAAFMKSLSQMKF